ncbi:MAG TPA: PAS domain-containing protein, partial [Gammaproteobacteria bacterium]
MGESREVGRTEESTIQTLIRRASNQPGEPGLDLICTKIAVDFQCLDEASADERLAAGLQDLTSASGADAAFLALLDPDSAQFVTVYSGRSDFSVCNPDVLLGKALEQFPWIASRLQHLRLLEIADTESPEPGQEEDARVLAGSQIAGVLLIGFNLDGKTGGLLGLLSAVPNPEWQADVQLALKLIGASCASGLERIRLQEDLMIVRERDQLVTNTANDGLWDYDYRSSRTFFSPRWRAMLGYSADEDVPNWQKLVHPDDLARVQAQLREHLEGRTALFESVHRMRHA